MPIPAPGRTPAVISGGGWTQLDPSTMPIIADPLGLLLSRTANRIVLDKLVSGGALLGTQALRLQGPTLTSGLWEFDLVTSYAGDHHKGGLGLIVADTGSVARCLGFAHRETASGTQRYDVSSDNSAATLETATGLERLTFMVAVDPSGDITRACGYQKPDDELRITQVHTLTGSPRIEIFAVRGTASGGDPDCIMPFEAYYRRVRDL